MPQPHSHFDGEGRGSARPSARSAGRRAAKLAHDGALAHVLDWLNAAYGAKHKLGAVGHRVVHGGTEFAAPVRADAVVLAKLDRLVPLAPLHQPHNLAPVRALLARIRGEGAMPAVQISVRAESERRPSGCGRGQG